VLRIALEEEPVHAGGVSRRTDWAAYLGICAR
jgi:hypothetical protein